MENVAKALFERFGNSQQQEKFQVFDNKSRHPAWQQKAEAAIVRTYNLWRSVGLPFPVDELMEQW